MKKIFTFLFLGAGALCLYAQNGQLTNGGFENWSVETISDTLDDWDDANSDQQGPATVFKSTDAFDQNHSAKISVATMGPSGQEDTLFGDAFHGAVGNNGPEGGIPYTDDFDEVKYHYKGTLVNDDTLFLLVIRFVSGVPQGLEIYEAAVGQTNSWTQGSISVNTTSQDELFIGFVMGNPFSNAAPTPGSEVWVDNVHLYDGGTMVTDVPDPSFENWSSVQSESPDSWFTLNDLLVPIGLGENVTKSTDASAGSYAAELTVMQEPQSGDTIGSVVSLGPIILSANDPFSGINYTVSPAELTGMYKYAPDNNDANAGLLVEFYENGNLIDGQYQSFTAQSSYTSFTLPFTITTSPDSLVLYAYAGDHPGSVLKIDELAFSGGNLSVSENPLLTKSKVYPNPAQDQIYFKSDKNVKYQIVDATGRVVMAGRTQQLISSFDVSSFDSGIYTLRMEKKNETNTLRFIVK